MKNVMKKRNLCPASALQLQVPGGCLQVHGADHHDAAQQDIKTHLDNTLYLSSLWSDLSCDAELVIADSKLVQLCIVCLLYKISSTHK